jgi:outer membrane protein assembly factor BamB
LAVVAPVLAAANLVAAPAAPATRPAGPAVVTPASAEAYSGAWITLSGGASGDKGARHDVPLYIGFRGGKAVVSWYAHPSLSGQKRLWLDTSTLTVGDGVLRGELRGRAVLGNDRGGTARDQTPDYVYELNGTVAADGSVKGTFTAKFTQPDGKPAPTPLTGGFAGVYQTEQQLKQVNSLPADQAWANYYGPTGTFHQTAGAARLVDDLSKARPVWKSEAWILTSYGNASDMRYADRGGYVAPGGGSSSPVVAGGVVYHYHYRPSPAAPFSHNTFAGKSIDERRAEAGKLFARDIERQWYLDLFRTAADDVVVAMDAATGKTLWTATFPQRSPNVQTHKMRWLFPVPLVDGDTLYAAGFGGRLYALDAKTGALRWEFPDASPAASTPAQGAQDSANCGTPSPVLIGGTLVYGTSKALFGIDPQTGKQRWTTKNLVGIAHRWSAGGQDRLVVTSIERRPRAGDPKKNDEIAVVSLLNPADGSVLWKADTQFQHYSYLPLLSGDLLLGYNFGQWDANKISGGRAIAYRLKPDGLEKAWETPLPNGTDSYGITCVNDKVYYSAEKETVCLDRQTGREMTRVVGPGGARTQVMFAAGDRVFIQPEGRHGALGWLMLDAATGKALPASTADPKTPWPGEWFPPMLHTTAYANQPIMFPIVDGRIFVRGGDGIYCYDLRQP